MGGKYLGTVIQTDSYFDTPQRSLLNAEHGLRIRRTKFIRSSDEHNDRRPLLTFKGPSLPGRRIKVRREVQTRLDDADAIVEIFKAVGLREVLVVQKRRASYRLGRCLVELDELPLIGCYVEIEAPDEKSIDRAAKKLALASEPITAHYVDLVTARCRRLPKACMEVTFDKCRNHCPKGE